MKSDFLKTDGFQVFMFLLGLAVVFLVISWGTLKYYEMDYEAGKIYAEKGLIQCAEKPEDGVTKILWKKECK